MVALAMLFVALLTLLVTLYHSVESHPIHISVVQLDYNAKTRSVELAIKIFADDLEAVINKQQNVVLRLGTPRELSTASALIFEYVVRHLKVGINGKSPSALQLVGKELEEEAVWVYVEIPNAAPSVSAIKTLTLANTILMDYYDDQSNLLNASVGELRRSALFRKGKETAVIEF